MFFGLTLTALVVALLAEGVDRNSCLQVESSKPAPSPSSQRAWIEISGILEITTFSGSPSSQRAWIEILSTMPPTTTTPSRPPRRGRG